MMRTILACDTDPNLTVWEGNEEYRKGNDGLGMCNLRSGHQTICALGGIGCNVNHILIARDNLRLGDLVGEGHSQ